MIQIIKYILWIAGIVFVIWLISSPSNSKQPVTRDTWVCTKDCSGHEAGHEWAEEHGITNPDDCGGNSQSFKEGCEAYANEQQIEY